jgi:hypothetical protein
MACPRPELLAAMAEARLTPDERDAVLDHAAGCDECRQTLLVLGGLKPAAVTRRLRPVASRGWVPWAAAAALFILSVVGVLLIGEEKKTETALRVAPKPAPAPEETPRLPGPADPPRPEIAPRKDVPAPEKAPAPVPATAPEVPAPPAPEKPQLPAPTPVPPTPEPPKAATTVVVAMLSKLEGEVSVVAGTARTPAKPGQELRQGEGVECRGPRSWAVLSYPDRTRLEIEGDTVVRELLPREAGKGLRVAVDKGAVRAEVAKQPAGQPMLFETPHGEAKVVGTILRVQVDADPKKGTRLDVEEGKVELRNAAGRSVLVEAGHTAVAAPGSAPAAKRYPKDEVIFAWDFEDGKKPAEISKAVVALGPDRRLCLAVESDAAGGGRLTIGDDDGLYVATGEEVFSFDYWVDPQASSVNMSLWDRTRLQAIEGALPKITTGKWTKATLRLADLGEVHIKEGDWVVSLLLQATGPAPRKFYVDNLVITRPRSLRPKTPDSK